MTNHTPRTIAAVIATLALIVGAGTAATAASTVKNAAYLTGEPVTYAVAGDSITDDDNPPLPDTWWKQLQASDDTTVQSVGGFARHGYTCAQIAANMPAVPTADVLVIACGTNDMRPGGPSINDTAAAIQTIAGKANARHVLLIPTPPTDYVSSTYDRRKQGQALNRVLIAKAASQGWLYADPEYMNRDPETNGYMPGTTVDGTHGTERANYNMSVRMSTYIKQAALGSAN